MKKEITSIFSSPLNRAGTYVLAFTFGAALFEFLRFIFHYSRTVTPAITVMILFVAIGFFIIHQRTLLSRITSASVLLVLGIVALFFDVYPFPDAYLLLLVLALSYLGSRSFLHAKYSMPRTLLMGVGIVILALLFTFFFIRMRLFIAI